jgi:hypothetical protein
MPLQIPDWLRPLWKFFVHTFVGTAIFVVIAVPAVLLHFLVKYLSTLALPSVLIWGFQGAEYLLFAVDWLLFAWFVIRAGIRAAKEL